MQHAYASSLRRPAGGREVVRELALVGAAALVYFGVRNLTVGSASTAFDNAAHLQSLEQTLSIAREQSLQDLLLRHDALVTLFNWIYIWGHWPVIIAVGVYLYRSHRDHYRVLRNAMFVSGLIGFALFAFFPVAPPRLVDPSLIDTVTLRSHSYRALQPPGLTNQYAAFPSLHFGWNLIVGFVLWHATGNQLLRVSAVLGPIAMAVAVVVTANHFLIDLPAGAIVVAAGLAVARSLAPGPAGYTRARGVPRGPSGRQRSGTAAGRRARRR
jgi:hypothetical protein